MLECFLQLLRHHFPPSNKLHKIFNKNTVKVSYCCTQNVASIIKSHNKKLINRSIKNTLPCNCRQKHGCPLDGKCRAENIVHKCVASVHGYPNKICLGATEGNFKQRFYNKRMSFNNEGRHNTFQICKEETRDNVFTKMVHHQICTSLFKYFQEMSVVSARKI